MNLTAIRAIKKKLLTAELCLLQSGGITWQTTFSPEPAEATIYIIDVLGTRKDWGKGGPGIT
jgi:Ni2+-binding GTPase involved in maturation of urease and hydrogenase